MTQHHIKRECNSIERLKETIEIAKENDYVVVGIETKVLEDINEYIRRYASNGYRENKESESGTKD